MDFTRSNVREMRIKFEEHLKKFSEENDVNVVMGGNIRFDSNEMKFKVEIKNKDERSSDVIDKEFWDKHLFLTGMKSDDFGKEFTMSDGHVYSICGIKPKARKNNIKIKRKSNGKVYVSNPDSVRFYLY